MNDPLTVVENIDTMTVKIQSNLFGVCCAPRLFVHFFAIVDFLALNMPFSINAAIFYFYSFEYSRLK
ncbi:MULTISPECIES: hypothetical protein [Brenneria]|uniref:Uncharacterized protein n=1 Tax=Brenneria nigrifluens DSM 30175 = ATCC 13028 TaxID=1121120 RepID=A0ABX5UXC7_9GAMM|nr:MULTISPECIES: hypothetical protein [Brenneria]QCR04119.1 hypothetical protein EH206_07955 [Brenneria nigrifluens DSM 30175 = ATCC 13028]